MPALRFYRPAPKVTCDSSHDKVSCRDGAEPVIASSARRHGVDDEDMLHAYRNAIDAYALDEGMVMLVGPSRSGSWLLEIGVVRSGDGTRVIVHAIKARPKFLR